MSNEHIINRLEGIRQMLLSVHKASTTSSNYTKGREREEFINIFLSNVMPPPFRFGSGEATDKTGHRTRQLDIVMEHPLLPSFSMPGSPCRLYLAESIAAVIEVKSDISKQWDQVVESAKSLANLKKDIRYTLASQTGASADPQKIPFFAVGYSGWKTIKTVAEKISEAEVDGILVIDDGIFVSSELFKKIEGQGPVSLWQLMLCLQRSTRILNSPYDIPIPEGYIDDDR